MSCLTTQTLLSQSTQMDNDLVYSNLYPTENHKSPNSFQDIEQPALHT